jgi:hypothetical protein
VVSMDRGIGCGSVGGGGIMRFVLVAVRVRAGVNVRFLVLFVFRVFSVVFVCFGAVCGHFSVLHTMVRWYCTAMGRCITTDV